MLTGTPPPAPPARTPLPSRWVAACSLRGMQSGQIQLSGGSGWERSDTTSPPAMRGAVAMWMTAVQRRQQKISSGETAAIIILCHLLLRYEQDP
jgi:hypothetical protein